MSSRYVGPKLPGKAGIAQRAIDFVIKKIPTKKKVSPDIKFIGPSKTVKKEGAAASIKKTKEKADFKNLQKVLRLKEQKKAGIKSARAASKELQRAAETKRATKIGREYFGRAVPATKADLRNPTVTKTKKFKTGKQLEAEEKAKAREKRMGGGMMGRRMGYSRGNPKPKTNVQKIKEAFATKSGLKKIDPKKQKGLAKLKKARPDVVRKMGYFKRGGRS